MYETSIQSIADGIAAIRHNAYLQAMEVAKDFHERRMEASEGFSNINVLVRERYEGRRVQIVWAHFHFRNGKRTGVTHLKKHRGSPNFDIAALKLGSPDWLHKLVEEAELKLRPLREALERLNEVERAMGVVKNRLTGEQAGKIEAEEEDGSGYEAEGNDNEGIY